MNLGITDVLDAMWREAIEPCGWGQGIGVRRNVAAVEHDVAFAIAADEVAEAHGVVDGGPAVGMDRHGIAYRNASVEDAYLFIFEDEAMVFGRGDDSVELRWPG